MMMSLSDLLRVSKLNIDLRDFNKPSISLALVNHNLSFARQCEELKDFLFWEIVEIGDTPTSQLNTVVLIKNPKKFEA